MVHVFPTNTPNLVYPCQDVREPGASWESRSSHRLHITNKGNAVTVALNPRPLNPKPHFGESFVLGLARPALYLSLHAEADDTHDNNLMLGLRLIR